MVILSGRARGFGKQTLSPRQRTVRQAQPIAFGLGGVVHFDKLSATPGWILGFGGRVRGGKERMKDEG